MGGSDREGEGDRRMREGEEWGGEREGGRRMKGEGRRERRESAILTIQKRNVCMCTFTNECASTACVHTCTQAKHVSVSVATPDL